MMRGNAPRTREPIQQTKSWFVATWDGDLIKRLSQPFSTAADARRQLIRVRTRGAIVVERQCYLFVVAA